MANVKFSELQQASESKDSDKIPILQDGVNKIIPSPILESKIKTNVVNTLTQQGGISLNLVNLKGVVSDYSDLSTITPTPNVNDAYQVESDGLVYVWNGTAFQANGQGFKIQPNVNGIVEEGNTQSVSGGEVFNNLPEYAKSKNLFNEEEIQIDKYVNSTSGGIDTGAGWICSDFISVSEGNYFLSGTKERQGVGFFDSNKVAVRYSGLNTGLVTVQSGESFVVFNLKAPTTAGYSDIQFEQGVNPTEYMPFGGKKVSYNSVEFYEEYLQKTDKNTDILSNINNVGSKDNLINPNKIQKKALLGDYGVILTGTITTDSYNTTEFIKIEPNTQYTGLRLDSTNIFRRTAFYSSNDVSSFISNISTAHSSFTTPSNALYLRTSIYNEFQPDTLLGDMTKVGLFKGTSPTWKYFGSDLLLETVPFTVKSSESIATISDVYEVIQEKSNGSISYDIKSNGLLSVDNEIGQLQAYINNNRGYNGNNVFNFNRNNILGVGVSGGDDAAPMHILGTTMGANHGYVYSMVTIPSHTFTNVDIGTEFIQGGVKFYMIRRINATQIAFLSENLGTEANPSFQTLTTGVISRNAIDYNITVANWGQLYPSVGELNKYIVVNNSRFNVDSVMSGKTDKLDINESYVIYDPSTVLDNLIARVGQSQDPSMIGEPNVKVDNIYRFVNNAVLVYGNVQFLKQISFADIMISQAAKIGDDNTTLYYVPNSNPLNGSVDLRKPTAIDWSNSIPETFVVNANQPDPNNPPNRIIQYKGNVGFMLCYILTRGIGKNISDHTDRTFEIRYNTGKVYPHPVESTKVGTTTNIGDAYSVAMARVYTDLTKTRVGNRLSVFQFQVDDETHVYIDYSGSMIDKINLDDFSLNGKSIEVLESKNTTLKNNIYNQGFVVNADYVEGETCYIVLMIK